MNSKKLLALFGLKWNPFATDVPVDGLWVSPRLERFAWQIENSLPTGGFAMVTGDPGSGKSVSLRLLDHRLAKIPDVSVGVLRRPQSHGADFYREMGDIFSVTLRPHNRWGGFKVLRERWRTHLDSHLFRPILLIDEAQAMKTAILEELRILASADFDSQSYLTVILAGDNRLQGRLEAEELLALMSRIRVRLTLEPASPDELREFLLASVTAAGNPRLMTAEVVRTLAEHCGGNYRLLTNIAMDLLLAGAEKEVAQLDEKLYFETFEIPQSRRSGAKSGRERS
jgi:general secretion pathway protein A